MCPSPRSKRPSILSVGVIRQGSSYGRQFESLYDRLADAYDIHHVGIDIQGEAQDRGWKLYPNNFYSDVRGCETFRSLLSELEPDIVFILNDLWKVLDPLEVLTASETNPKVVVACPVDGAIVEKSLVDFLSRVDSFVVFTEFSQKTVQCALRENLGEEAVHQLRKITVIPNGVDRSSFYPLGAAAYGEEARSGRRLARAALFPGRPELLDSFIVLNANMNQPRKRLDLTLEGFAQFARGKAPTVQLLLHSKWDEPEQNLRVLAQRFGIADRLLSVADPARYPRVDDPTLNQIYNACEIGLNTSTGEGWGLVSFEHAATGAAQVLARNRCGDELWNGSAELVEPVSTITKPELFLESQIISAGGVARTLERLFRSPDHLRAVSKACYENAIRAEYDWSAIASQWDTLFKSVLAEPRADRAPGLTA